MEIQTTKKRYNTLLALYIDNFVSLSINDSSITELGSAYLFAHYCEDYLYITTLFTKPLYRGKNYASTLLKRAIYEAKKNKCKCIKLMDHSDKFNNNDNIYLKHGFEYENLGQPEMILLFKN
jgi:GNAT superfamily N-acetyltransferase